MGSNCRISHPAMNGHDFRQLTKEHQEFLDTNQYSTNGITRYEEIFGKTFVSTGGKTTTEAFVAMLDLKPGMKVLDIGSGAGGSAFLMARKYGVDVHGIDLSTNMHALSVNHRQSMEPEVKHRVNFYIEDADKMEFPANFYDVVYSRDTIMHFSDAMRNKVYRNILKTLKPGGKLLVSDYCRGEKESTQECLDDTGFTNVVAADKTDFLIKSMRRELKDFYEMKGHFINKYSQKDFDDLESGWKEKLVWCPDGLFAWGLFTATK